MIPHPERRLSQRQEILNYLELVYKHPWNVYKRFQKYISSKAIDIEQFSQLYTEPHTHMSKYRAVSPMTGQLKIEVSSMSGGFTILIQSYKWLLRVKRE